MCAYVCVAYPSCHGSTQFTCDNGRCIPLTAKCNGFSECRDNSDEKPDLCGESSRELVGLIVHLVNNNLLLAERCLKYLVLAVMTVFKLFVTSSLYQKS